MECTEDSPALLELEGDEGDDVEGCVVDSAEANGDAGSDTLWVGLDVSEVQSLLAYLGHLSFNREYHVVSRVRHNLGAGHTHHDAEVVGQVDACNLGVDNLSDGHGDQATSLEVSHSVVVSRASHLVSQYGGGVLALL